ncbi:MAG: radical SAM protein [Azospirillaceae bacterium]|nr:radical SAM protein [Azospirillaceae bacterium]
MDYQGGRSWGRLRPIAMDAVRECPPYGIYMLAGVLGSAGHDVTLVDLIAAGSRSVRPWLEDLGQCGLIGIGATSMSWPTAHDVIRQLRRAGVDAPIVLGGIHPTMFDRHLLRNFDVQYVVRGEGEVALPTLCAALEGKGDLSAVPNLSWRTAEGEIVRNAVAPKIDKSALPEFPLPDYAALPAGIYKGLAIESSRGCAFDCSFCSTSYRQSWRGMAAERFVDRLEAVMAHLPRTRYRTTHIIDDEFSMNPKRAIEIATVIRQRGLHPKLVYDSRATDLLWPGFVDSIAEFTCQFLVGAECGYDEGLKRIGKGSTCKILEDAARVLHQHNLSEQVDYSFILGLPWETRAEVEKTIRFAMHLHATYGVRVLLQWYCQIPGSRLWEEDRRRAVVTEAMYDDYGFFRDPYMFRSGVQLTPAEIWEVGDMVEQLKWLAKLMTPGRKMIEFAFPLAIHQSFPRESLDTTDTGLASLRQIAHPGRAPAAAPMPPSAGLPPMEVGIPQRHFVGVD